MKRISKKTISILLGMAILLMSYTSVCYGEEKNENYDIKKEWYNTEAEEQSVLYVFLGSSLFAETLASIMEANDLCNFCAVRDEASLKFTEGYPDFLKKLGLNEKDDNLVKKIKLVVNDNNFPELENEEDDSSDEEYEYSDNCDLCALISTFEFRELRNKLFSKMRDLCDREYYLLKEQDEEIAEEVIKHLKGFEVGSEEELTELIMTYLNLYGKIKEMGNFPNILDNLMILKDVASDVVMFMREVKEHAETEFAQTFSVLSFAKLLANYKEFLLENNEILVEMGKIANNEFKIESMDNKEIESLSEVLLEANRIQSVKKSPEEENRKQVISDEIYAQIEKDLL